MNRKEVFTELKPYFTKKELEKVEVMYNLTKLGHGYKKVQTRDDGSRYFEHPKEVMMIIFIFFKVKTDLQSLLLALAHDLGEDVYLMIQALFILFFGNKLARSVMFVTKDDDSKPIFFERLLCCDDWRAVMVKLADRIHNMRTLGSCDRKKQLKQVAETEKYYFVLCDYLETIIPKRYAHVVDIARDELRRLCFLHR